MNNKVKILTAVVGVIVVGLGVGVTLMQTKTSEIQEPIVPVVVEVEETHKFEEVDVETTEEVEPTPEEIGEPDTIEVVEPTTVIEPTPVVVAEPEPTSVVVVEPEATPVVVAEPEPTPVIEATTEAPQAIEEQATYEPAPQEPVVAEAPASGSSGQTYTTWYKDKLYTVTQEQMDRAWVEGAGWKKTDGIPAMVFSQIKNEGFSTGTSGMTSEEVRDQLANPTVENQGAVVWS